MSMIYDTEIFPLFILRIKLEVERSLFNNGKTTKAWGLKNETLYFDETYDFMMNAIAYL